MVWFKMLLITFFYPTFLFWICRINAMTFKTFSRSITIRNERLARVLIAYENTWGIATSADKRNKMSLLGVISYILLLPEIVFIMYDWGICLTTGRAELCSAEKTYIAVLAFFYLITLSVKVIEADKFDKGKIW